MSDKELSSNLIVTIIVVHKLFFLTFVPLHLSVSHLLILCPIFLILISFALMLSPTSLLDRVGVLDRVLSVLGQGKGELDRWTGTLAHRVRETVGNNGTMIQRENDDSEIEKKEKIIMNGARNNGIKAKDLKHNAVSFPPRKKLTRMSPEVCISKKSSSCLPSSDLVASKTVSNTVSKNLPPKLNVLSSSYKLREKYIHQLHQDKHRERIRKLQIEKQELKLKEGNIAREKRKEIELSLLLAEKRRFQQQLPLEINRVSEIKVPKLVQDRNPQNLFELMPVLESSGSENSISDSMDSLDSLGYDVNLTLEVQSQGARFADDALISSQQDLECNESPCSKRSICFSAPLPCHRSESITDLTNESISEPATVIESFAFSLKSDVSENFVVTSSCVNLNNNFLKLILTPGLRSYFFGLLELSDLFTFSHCCKLVYKYFFDEKIGKEENFASLSLFFSNFYWTFAGEAEILNALRLRDYFLTLGGGMVYLDNFYFNRARDFANTNGFNSANNRLCELHKNGFFEIIGVKSQRPEEFRVANKAGGFGEPIRFFLAKDKNDAMICFRVVEENQFLQRSANTRFKNQAFFSPLANSTTGFCSDAHNRDSRVSSALESILYYPIQFGSWLRICKDKDSSVDTVFWIVACEFFPFGSLRDIMIHRGFAPFSELQIARIAFFILKSLKRLHQKNIPHRALHSKNIYITSGGIVKLENYTNVFSFVDSFFTGKAGTSYEYGHMEHLAPELLANSDVAVDVHSDVYCFGHVIFELVTGRRFGHGFPSQMKVLDAIANRSIVAELPETVSPVLRSFLEGCFALNPICRSTVEELLQHEFLLTIGTPALLFPKSLFPNRRDAPNYSDFGFKSIYNEHLSWLRAEVIL